MMNFLSKMFYINFVIILTVVLLVFTFLIQFNALSQTVVTENQSSVSSSAIITVEECSNVSANLRIEAERFSSISTEYIKTIKNFTLQLKDLSLIISSDNINIDKLAQNINLLDEKNSNIDFIFTRHVSSLTELSKSACEIGNEEFLVRLDKIKTARKSILELTKEIFVLIKEDVKNNLIEIRGKYRLN